MNISKIILSNISGDEQEKAQKMISATKGGLVDKMGFILKNILETQTSLSTETKNNVLTIFKERFKNEILDMEIE